MRYAWFSQARRLAIESNGQVIIYDTLDHNIGGVSQQQSVGNGGYSVTFSSQYGYVDLSRLPVVSINGQPPLPASAPSDSSNNFAPAVRQPQPTFHPCLMAVAAIYLPTSKNWPSCKVGAF